jgi:O-antigen ligase
VAVTAIALLVNAGRTGVAAEGSQRALDLALAAVLGAVLLQAIPLPAPVVRTISPARDAFVAATSLQQPPSAGFVPLTLDTPATGHAFLSLFCTILAFWTARELFGRGGIRTFSTIIAWGAIAIALLAFAQHAAGTPLVYGFWRPLDPGARPLGPFINRNHLGTWSIMAICLCAGYLQWRSANERPPASWRARASRLLDGRRLVLQLAVVLLASAIALGASRSALVALACAAGYVAAAAPASRRGRGRASVALLAVVATIGMVGYGDGARLLMRLDETRATGMANRMTIWQDTVPLIRHFPIAGVGAGAFATAMRVYQTSPRTYYHNEAHNQYLQVAAEGGLLILIPALAVVVAFLGSAWGRLRRPDDPLRWMRVAAAGALVGVAVQSIWETGLTLPANGMFAAAMAALIVHAPPHPPDGHRREHR